MNFITSYYIYTPPQLIMRGGFSLAKLFGSDLRPQTLRRPRCGHIHFAANTGPKYQNKNVSIILTDLSHVYSIDNGILIYSMHNIIETCQIMVEVWPKNVCPI